MVRERDLIWAFAKNVRKDTKKVNRMDIIHILKFKDSFGDGISITVYERWNAYCSFKEINFFRTPVKSIWEIETIEQLEKVKKMEIKYADDLEEFRICKRCEKSFRKENEK